MNDRSTELETALGLWVEEAATARGPHPEPEELADYHRGIVAQDTADRVRRHLVVCAECRDLLLEVERFEPSPPDAVAEAAWESLAGCLTQGSPAPAAEVVPFARPAAAKPASTWLPWAVAASFLITTVGLGGWALQLRQTVLDLGRPQINAPIIDLYPGGAQRSAVEEGGVELPAGTRLVTLVLNLPGPAEHDHYRAEIVDGERIVWIGEDLEANRYGSLTLILPRRLLSSQEISVRLYSDEPDGGELVDVYSLALE